MVRLALMSLAFLLGACATHPLPAPESDEARGRVLVQRHCGDCHATGRFGESPAPEAPEFRRLSRNYRVDGLEEALAEGISVGHPAMPQFAFAPADVTAIVAYLQSIQSE